MLVNIPQRLLYILARAGLGRLAQQPGKLVQLFAQYRRKIGRGVLPGKLLRGVFQLAVHTVGPALLLGQLCRHLCKQLFGKGAVTLQKRLQTGHFGADLLQIALLHQAPKQLRFGAARFGLLRRAVKGDSPLPVLQQRQQALLVRFLHLAKLPKHTAHPGPQRQLQAAVQLGQRHLHHVVQPRFAPAALPRGHKQQQAKVGFGHGGKVGAAAAKRGVQRGAQHLFILPAQPVAAGGHRHQRHNGPRRKLRGMHFAIGLKIGKRRLADENRVHDLAFHHRLNAGEQLAYLPLALRVGAGLVDLRAQLLNRRHRGLALFGL